MDVDMHGNACKLLRNGIARNVAYNTRQSLLHNQVKAAYVAACELSTMNLVKLAADARPNCVDYRCDLSEVERLSEDCIACRTTVESGTCDVQARPSSPKDTAAYAATSLELVVCGVDNDVYIQGGNVGFHEHDLA